MAAVVASNAWAMESQQQQAPQRHPQQRLGGQQQRQAAAAAAAPRRVACRAAQGQQPATQPFPQDYNQAVRQAQAAVQAALADGATLLEVEFPTASLASVAGDAEGANEMTYSLGFLRQFMRIFQQQADTTRIFFPDPKELQVALKGKGMDPAAGSWTLDPVFEGSSFQFGYLMKPNPFLDMGITIGKINAADQLNGREQMLVMAYPHFNPQEMLEVAALHTALVGSGRGATPIITFNAEIDRIRTGYYPPLFYPAIGKIAQNFIPKFTTAYYVKNFKGATGGAIFRCYPGPYQIYSRTAAGFSLVEERQEMPSLKEVSLEVLPRAAAKAASAAKR